MVAVALQCNGRCARAGQRAKNYDLVQTHTRWGCTFCKLDAIELVDDMIMISANQAYRSVMNGMIITIVSDADHTWPRLAVN